MFKAFGSWSCIWLDFQCSSFCVAIGIYVLFFTPLRSLYFWALLSFQLFISLSITLIPLSPVERKKEDQKGTMLSNNEKNEDTFQKLCLLYLLALVSFHFMNEKLFFSISLFTMWFGMALLLPTVCNVVCVMSLSPFWCHVCHRHAESPVHLFFHCSFATSFWGLVLSAFGCGLLACIYLS